MKRYCRTNDFRLGLIPSIFHLVPISLFFLVVESDIKLLIFSSGFVRESKFR